MVFFIFVAIIYIHMGEPKKNDIKMIVGAIKRSSLKFIPLDKLSRLVGLYPDVISDELVFFDPMIKFDPTVNTRDLLGAMEVYLGPESPKVKVDHPKRVVVTKKELSEYPSITDFVYKKMTSIGGLVDTSLSLSDQNLHILQKLVNAEVAARKKAARKKKKK